MKFYACSIGEKNPDFVSSRIQGFLTWLYKITVDWSHCGIEVEFKSEGNCFWDSTGRGFDQCSVDEALDHGQAVMRKRLELRVVNEQAAYHWLLGCRGKSYSQSQYVLFFVLILPFWMQALIKNFSPKWIRNLCRNGAGRLVCSEALGRFIKDNCEGAFFDPRLADGVLDDLDPYEVMLIAKDYSV
jgi:hypothetical protein